MKISNYIYPALIMAVSLSACSKIIDLKPESNVTVENFYKNYDQVNTALTGCYNGLQKPLESEWMLTELRSDISKQGSPGSTANANVELNNLNTYQQNASQSSVYDYWLNTYQNIRSTNYVLRSLGATYANGQTGYTRDATADLSAEQRNRMAGEAAFIRAYHYFNLVRLYGGVFLLTDPVAPEKLKQMNRSSVEETYALITADLKAAAAWLPDQTVAQQAATDKGRATIWAAKALLAKVYLTLNQKPEALELLNEVITMSGHDLLTSFADVFSITNEMNKEILFAVRYKAGGLGLGNYMANSFAALNSGSAIVNGNGSGLNYPTINLESKYIVPTTGAKDARKEVTIGRYNLLSYVKKYISPVVLTKDAENDFPVIRYSDVLLMKAEALGFGAESVALINKVRQRAGATAYPGTGNFSAAFYLYPETGAEAVTSTTFIDKLLLERRIELAFENQRIYDLYRTGQFEAQMNIYYEAEYDEHYKRFNPPLTLAELKANILIRPLLPIPQKELDTNNEIEIPQNKGY